jgi:hypothetical protein
MNFSGALQSWEKLTATPAASISVRQEKSKIYLNVLIELAPRRGLIGAHPACNNFRAKIILGADGSVCHPAQKGDLAHVCECVGDRTLKEFFHRGPERFAGSQVSIEGRKRGEESLRIHFPGLLLGITPLLFSL